jgi:hypothetical protein
MWRRSGTCFLSRRNGSLLLVGHRLSDALALLRCEPLGNYFDLAYCSLHASDLQAGRAIDVWARSAVRGVRYHDASRGGASSGNLPLRRLITQDDYRRACSVRIRSGASLRTSSVLLWGGLTTGRMPLVGLSPQPKAKVAGHADVKTAMKYQHPETNSIREAIERRNQCHNSRHSPAGNDGKC